MFPPKSLSLHLPPIHSYTHILLHRNPNSIISLQLQNPKIPNKTKPMDSSSAKVNPRKRKKQTPSFPDPLVGIFTRSKSQIYGNFSGRARLDASGKSNFDAISVSSSSCPGKPKSVTEPVESCLPSNDEINSGISSVKDLRAHRVFSPAVYPIIEEERKIEGNSKVLQNEDMDMDSGKCIDLVVGDKKVEETKQSSETMLLEADAKENNNENGLNLKDEAISTNGSASRSKTVLNSCGKRKVFKTPSSFSYRRLLPYLMDIAKEDSGASEIEVVDVELPNKMNKSSSSSPKKMSIMGNDCPAKLECTRAPTNSPTKRVVDEEIQKCDKEQPHILQMSSVQHQLEHTNHKNGVDSVGGEEHILMKPDADILSETVVREDEKSMEVNTSLSKKPDLKCTSVGCASVCNKSCQSPNGKSGNHGKTEPFLIPCSRLRVFKAQSSFSYRRMLPYLIDVAKESSCNSTANQHRKPQIDSKHVHQLSHTTSDEENHMKEIMVESFSKQSHTEDEEQQNLLPATDAPVSGSSSDTADNLSPSTPPLHCTSDSSKVGRCSVVSANTTNQMMPLDLSKGELNLVVHNSSQKSTSAIADSDIMDCDEKSNCSAVQSCSVVENDILTEESCSKDSESRPVDTNIKSISVSGEAHKSDKEIIQEVNSSQSPPHIEVSDTLVAPTDGPLKGILKRNPRGCRGPCNCLNCASFRLHAEKAFEFSRNQMLDVEEVAYGLMKELANVRYILEKSAVNESGLTTIQLNQAQVKQVCNQALETETLAKECLNRLNNDLNVHCRIPTLQRPSVTFSNRFQERIIPKTDMSTSPEKAR